MQSDQKALTNGLLFGSDEGFSPELKQLTALAGVTHLVAASGANLRFVSTVWNGLFAFLGNRFILYTSIFGILGYWFLAEQSGSLWRASLMWGITWAGSLLGKRIPLWYSLSVTTILTTVLWPQFLSAGFWLSSLAMCGIFFSRMILPGEKKSILFPRANILHNKVALSLSEGSIIFVMVTVWLWSQYQVFQPLGILSTYLLSFLVDPLVWIGIFELGVSWGGNDNLVVRLVDVPQHTVFSLFWFLLSALARQGETSSPLYLGAAAGGLIVFQVFQKVKRLRWGNKWRNWLVA